MTTACHATTAALAANVVGGGRITVTLDRYVAGDQLFVDGKAYGLRSAPA